MPYLKAEIRGAILRAADRIEQTPSSYNFGDVYTPEDGGCGTTACAWGWIGFELGFKGGTLINKVADSCGVKKVAYFLTSAGHLYEHCRGISNAAEAPAALRAYADKYFPAEVVADPTHIPCSTQFLTQLSSWMRKGERQVVT